VRLLIVGGGSIGERHLRCFRKVRKSLSAEICEPRARRRRELERRYDLAGVHPDFSRLDPSGFDAAVVATPANLHVAQARRLVEAGCHVLIEKPLCVTERGVAGLRAAARRRRRTVGVAYTYRSYPALVEMARRIRAGQLGRPTLARARLAYHYPRYRPDYRTNYFANPETGGGAVMDIASHAVAYLTGVLGAVAEVSCLAGRLGLRGVAVEDTALLVLRFASGALGEVWTSACQPRRETEIEVIGARGQLGYRTLFDRGGSELAFVRGDRSSRRASRVRLDPDGPFTAQARNFLAAIAGRGALRTSLEEALHVNRVCRAALRSARTGRRVAVR
jgi:predicted dehydrogenase